MKIISIINQKGGVGKTTTDRKKTYTLSQQGKKTLNDTLKIWDLDYEVKKSLTNDDSFILNIKKIKKKIS